MRDYDDKLIGEFLEWLALDCFDNPFTTDTRTPGGKLFLMRLTMDRNFLLSMPFIFQFRFSFRTGKHYF